MMRCSSLFDAGLMFEKWQIACELLHRVSRFLFFRKGKIADKLVLEKILLVGMCIIIIIIMKWRFLA